MTRRLRMASRTRLQLFAAIAVGLVIATACGSTSPNQSPPSEQRALPSNARPLQSSSPDQGRFVDSQKEISLEASGPPTIVIIEVQGLSFTPNIVRVPSGSQVTIGFLNKDPGVAHDLSLLIPGQTNGPTYVGPCNYTVQFVAPAPGRNGFVCVQHSYMTGVIIVDP